VPRLAIINAEGPTRFINFIASAVCGGTPGVPTAPSSIVYAEMDRSSRRAFNVGDGHSNQSAGQSEEAPAGSGSHRRLVRQVSDQEILDAKAQVDRRIRV